MGQLCPPGPTCNTGFEASDVIQSWDGFGYSLATGIDSTVRPEGHLAAIANGNLETATMRLATFARDLIPQARVFGLADVRLGDTLTVLNSDGTPYVGSGISSLHLDISGYFAGSGGTGFLGGIYAQVFEPGYFDALISGQPAPNRIAIQTLLLEPGRAVPASLDLSFAASGPFEIELARCRRPRWEGPK